MQFCQLLGIFCDTIKPGTIFVDEKIDEVEMILLKDVTRPNKMSNLFSWETIPLLLGEIVEGCVAGNFQRPLAEGERVQLKTLKNPIYGTINKKFQLQLEVLN